MGHITQTLLASRISSGSRPLQPFDPNEKVTSLVTSPF